MALRHAVEWGLLFTALAAEASPLAAATYGDGQRAYDTGQFEEARRIWTPLAEAGDAEAQAALGLLYDLGQGVPADPAAAHHWYRRAAEAGLARAQFNVAVMQDSGVGVPQNAVEAATWYARAAARGHHRAQYNLAQLYSAGDGVLRNIAQARVWYRAAARGGLTAAADKLAAIERDTRPGASPASGKAAGLPIPVIPVAPLADLAVDAQSDPVTVELVWVAPTQPGPVRFFVQVPALESKGLREIFADYVDESATLVQLDRAPAHYVWRVFAVAEGATHYAVGDWSRFTVRNSD